MATLARSVPDDATIYAAWKAAKLAGEHGAKSRAARACGVSTQHVCNVLIRHRPRTSWAYEPCPGEIEQQTRLAQLYAAEKARIETACADPLLQRLVLETFNAPSTQPAEPSSESFIDGPIVYVPGYDPRVPAAWCAAVTGHANIVSVCLYIVLGLLEVWPLVIALLPFGVVLGVAARWYEQLDVAARQGRILRSLRAGAVQASETLSLGG